jgi:hypothetical protein
MAYTAIATTYETTYAIPAVKRRLRGRPRALAAETRTTARSGEKRTTSPPIAARLE